MKVVLFCGGRGLRLIGDKETVPKPMTMIGYRPMLWHLMRYYAHFGHTDFILCLGHRSDLVKQYFLDYPERLTNDFIMSGDGHRVDLLTSDMGDWTITFVDTGFSASVGERLRAVRSHIGDDEWFLANYADGLTDLDLDGYVQLAKHRNKVASFLTVQPPHSYHVVRSGGDGLVHKVEPVMASDTWINAGFFAFRNEIFDYLRPGEDLVDAPFERLIAARQLYARRYEGFWRGMDTFKDHEELERLYTSGAAPWEVWSNRFGAPVASHLVS